MSIQAPRRSVTSSLINYLLQAARWFIRSKIKNLCKLSAWVINLVNNWSRVVLCISGVLLPLECYASSEIWVLIDTAEQQLSVMSGDKERLTFSNIAIGRYGASSSRMKGDNQTPLGSFQVSWLKQPHRYSQFFGINFPNQEAADLALAEKRIPHATWVKITKALESNKLPPQDTPLGGYIGIHGVGRGDNAVHSSFNWTNGCVALTNTQIKRLGALIKVGTRVVIR